MVGVVARNPFTPSFGVSPPALVGRDNELREFAEALEDGPGAPARACLFTGVRGSGKTVALNAVEDVARAQGWLVISETTRRGVAGQIARTHLPRLLAEHAQDPDRSKVTGANVSVAGFGLGISGRREDAHPVEQSLRTQLELLSDVLAPRGTGVLISLDEVHRAAMGDLQEITQAVQHMFREGREVAFVAAGLPASVTDLLNDDVMTFLRRAERFHLGRVSRTDVERALAEPLGASGRDITGEALRIAADGTRGYPFMVQLVGHRTWSAGRDASVLTAVHAHDGVEAAARRMGRMVHQPALAALSGIDRRFLAAMAVDPGPSRIADIAERMGVDANYANQYRRRLVAEELIEPTGHGLIDFTLPRLREYLRGHEATAYLGEISARDSAPGFPDRTALTGEETGNGLSTPHRAERHPDRGSERDM